MARFDVHKMKEQADVPLVVDVQADFLEDLRTRMVIPLLPMADAKDEVAVRLKPVVNVAGEPFVLMTTDVSAIASSALGECVASIERQQQLVIDALDFLFQGF